jgi:ubiquinone/menaquinone biosynthesis C-methylase UbiE
MSGVNSVNLTAAATAFDRVAHSYDDVFTRSVIGRAQRNQVWQRLLAAFSPGKRILELNCGTGEDARFLAQKGRSVVACDASSVMIEVAEGRGKLEAGSGSAGIEYRQLANEDLSALLGQETFDGAFSNFSGLNCVADLQPVARNLARLVKPGSRVLICVWSRVCVAELAWFLLHGQVGKAFRRLSGKAAARVGGVTIEVSYPTVHTVRRVFSPWFRLESHNAVGLFVPPSYVESWARKHDKLFARLEKLDQVFSSFPMFRVAGDHVLLEFVRCDS